MGQPLAAQPFRGAAGIVGQRCLLYRFQRCQLGTRALALTPRGFEALLSRELLGA